MDAPVIKAKRKGGFASMDPEKRKQVAAMGGKKAHELGVGHRFAAGEEAREAGRKGGRVSKRGKVEPKPEETEEKSE